MARSKQADTVLRNDHIRLRIIANIRGGDGGDTGSCAAPVLDGLDVSIP